MPEQLLTICYAYKDTRSASCLESFGEMVETDRGNFTGAYPPLYYSFMGLFASEDISGSIVAMRLTNAAIFVGLASNLFALLRRGQRGPLVWAALGSFVPLGVFLIPSVNPSSWALTSAVVLWLALVAYFRADSIRIRASLAVLAVVAAVMGSGARADSAVYSALAALLAVVLSFERTIAFLKLAALPVLIVIIAIAFFFASGQSEVVNPDALSDQGVTLTSIRDLAQINLMQLPSLWAGVHGTWGLGWLDTEMPAMVWVPMIGLFYALVIWGLRRVDARKAIALSISFLSLVLVPMYILARDRVIVGEYVQPRYIFPLLIILLGIALMGLRRDDLGLSSAQIWVVGGMLTIANSAALHTNIRRYVTGTDKRGINLDSGAEWWWNLPFGPVWVWAVGSFAFLVMFALLVRLLRAPATTLPQPAVSAAQLR